MSRPKRIRASAAPFDTCVEILDGPGDAWSKREHASIVISKAAESDGALARRAFLAVYNLQTATERDVGHSRGSNGLGFDRFDGVECTALAAKILAGAGSGKRDKEKILESITKYRVQLVKNLSREELKAVFDGVGYKKPPPPRVTAPPDSDESKDDDDEDESEDENDREFVVGDDDVEAVAPQPEEEE